ncbi:MAG: YafY family transcriptional regulator [Firmicutes bacterium]|nr:YafY family transcriptional regulator [Bacillota bacterium]
MRVNRLLSILLILSNKGLVTGKELAQHFEVSVRTIYRDIDKICEAGVPVASDGGKGGGFYIMENYDLDNLFFNEEELQTLVPLMDNLSFLFGKNKNFNDIVLKFKNKYEKLESDRLKIDMSHFSMEKELKEFLFLINKAIEESKLLKFQYINRNMEHSKRIAEPIQINFSSGQWYLTAFCRIRNDYRRFKLVRMRNLSLGFSFNKRDISQKELDKIFEKSYEKGSIKVKLKFNKEIGLQLTEYFDKNKIKKTKDDTYIVEDDFPYEEGLIKYILSFGKKCEVLEPSYFRQEVKNYLNNLLKQYNN